MTTLVAKFGEADAVFWKVLATGSTVTGWAVEIQITLNEVFGGGNYERAWELVMVVVQW